VFNQSRKLFSQAGFAPRGRRDLTCIAPRNAAPQLIAARWQHQLARFGHGCVTKHPGTHPCISPLPGTRCLRPPGPARTSGQGFRIALFARLCESCLECGWFRRMNVPALSKILSAASIERPTCCCTVRNAWAWDSQSAVSKHRASLSFASAASLNLHHRQSHPHDTGRVPGHRYWSLIP